MHTWLQTSVTLSKAPDHSKPRFYTREMGIMFPVGSSGSINFHPFKAGRFQHNFL